MKHNIFFVDAYNGNELDLQWNDKPIEFKMEEIQIEGYEFLDISTSNNTVKYITGGKHTKTDLDIDVC